MNDRFHQRTHPAKERFCWPVAGLGLAWVAGMLTGWQWGRWLWPVILPAAGLCWAVGLWHGWRGRMRWGWWLMGLAVGLVGLGWPVAWLERAERGDLRWVAGPQGRLVDLSGRVCDRPRVQLAGGGVLGEFAGGGPQTRFVLAVDRWFGAGRVQAASGKVMVKIEGMDWRIRQGDRVRVQGWLKAVEGPANPGEPDRRWRAYRRGIVGQVYCKSRGNCRWQGTDRSLAGWWAGWRDSLSRQVRWALAGAMGGRTDRSEQALLEALVLGWRGGCSEELDRAFRRTGQAHLLSISGLHVGIVALGAWAVVLLLSGRPDLAGWAGLVAVGLYGLVVPMRVPLLRSAVMAGVCFAAMARGRGHRAVTGLVLAGWGLLAWRPGDLFEPGFQLSFVIVTGLMLFAGPLVRRWGGGPGSGPVRRWVVGYAVVGGVAFMMGLPVVIYHFGLVSPYAPVVGLVMLPLVMAALWLGMLTVVLAVLCGGLGQALGCVLGAVGGMMADMVGWVERLPGAWEVVRGVPGWWAWAAMGVVMGLLGGAMHRRVTAAVVLAGAVVLTGWLVWPVRPVVVGPGGGSRPAVMTVHMLAVDNGSCYVVRSGGRAWMFDCGSALYPNVAEGTVLPVLRQMGVLHLEGLVISHADLDHFNGVPEVVERLGVGRVLTSRWVLEAAERQPWSAVGGLVGWLRSRGVPIHSIGQGWRGRLGAVQVRVLWPPEGAAFATDNDLSLVMSFETAGRRVMLCGDIQESAMGAMLERGMDLSADVCELPHHGSYSETAWRWLGRVGPVAVLQSTGPERLKHDRWAGRLGSIRRLAGPWGGMATVSVAGDGTMSLRTFFRVPREPVNR